MSLNFEPVPYEEAARIVAEKQIMSKAAFDSLVDELKARAFTIAGLEDLRAVQEIRDAIAELPRGAAWEDVKAQVAEKLEDGGFSPAAAEHRATLLLRHHGFAAYAQEKYRNLQEMKDVFPYWKYQTMGDEKVRSTHAALDGLILPADDPFWKDHYPPWEWNCRCMVVGVTEEEYEGAQQVGDFDPADPDARAEGWKLSPAQAERLRQGQLDDGSGQPVFVGRQGSLHFDPSGPGLDMEEISKRYDPGDWARFRERMEAEKLADGRSVWEWANGVMTPKVPGGAGGPVPGITGGTGRPATPRQDADAAGTENTRKDIESAHYTSARPIGEGSNGAQLLKNGKTVVFKAGADEDNGLRPGVIPAGTQWKREIAASKIDEALGFGLVPPTGRVVWKGVAGSAQLHQSGITPKEAYLLGQLEHMWNAVPMEERVRLRVLDCILHNTDRHGGNFLLRQDGSVCHIVAIDNGLTCPVKVGGFFGQLRTPDKPYSGPLPDAILRQIQQFVDNERQIRQELKPNLEPAALSGVFARAKAILKTKEIP